MTSKYEDYTKGIYKTIREDIADAKQEGGSKPAFLFSGEAHEDSPQEEKMYADKNFPDEAVNPAIAGACAHIAAMKAAIDEYGKENVTAAFEMDQETLDTVIEQIEQMGGDYPAIEAIKFAIENGLDIKGFDPKFQEYQDNPTAKERLDAQVDFFQKYALETGNSDKIIVAIGGSAHIGYLHGHTPEDLGKNGNNLNATPGALPIEFEGMYGKMLFYNSAQNTPNYPYLEDLYEAYPDIEKKAQNNQQYKEYLAEILKTLITLYNLIHLGV